MQHDLDVEKLPHLNGGRRQWWDIAEKRVISSATAYIQYGCPDWGETNGERNALCQFCGFPNGVRIYRDRYYGGGSIPTEDHLRLFEKTLRVLEREGAIHTLMIFNAGSFTAMPLALQESLLRASLTVQGLRRVVIESRAPLITEPLIESLARITQAAGVLLSVRIGIETKDDQLRLKVLKKGHSRAQLRAASVLLREHGVTSGGYVMLKPAPGLDPAWSVQESIDTIEWILGDDGLGMDEVYLGPTCVSPDTPLSRHWDAGDFTPPSLWNVYDVLTATAGRFPGRVHLLMFKDEPPFVAVPSNHVPRGLPQSLEGSDGCDAEFHAMLDDYRARMDTGALREIACSCRENP